MPKIFAFAAANSGSVKYPASLHRTRSLRWPNSPPPPNGATGGGPAAPGWSGPAKGARGWGGPVKGEAQEATTLAGRFAAGSSAGESTAERADAGGARAAASMLAAPRP